MNNQNEIINTCNRLNLFLNKNHVYQFKNSSDTVGNLGILPVHVALSIINKDRMPNLSFRIAEAGSMIDLMHVSKTEKHKLVSNMDRTIKSVALQYRTYANINKKNPKCFVYTSLKKINKSILPTAESFSQAFYQHENSQLKAINNLYHQAEHILDRVQNIHDDLCKPIQKKIANADYSQWDRLHKLIMHQSSHKAGKLLYKLNGICKEYNKKFHDKDINTSDVIKRRMIEPVTKTRARLSNEIGSMVSPSPRQHLLATDYDFIINHCRLNDFIEDKGASDHKSKITLLSSDVVFDIIDDTAAAAQKKRKVITKRICKALNLA